MTDELTKALTETLKTAAQNAPGPPPDLVRRVERRHRARRRGQAGLAMAAVLVVIGGSGMIASALGSGDDGPDAAQPAERGSPGPLTPATPATPVPMKRLWPQAMRTVPDTLPDGRRYHPITLLDDTRLLATTESSLEKTNQIVIYDLGSRRVTRAIQVPVPSDAELFPADFSVGEGHVAWWLKRSTAGRSVIEIWAAPLEGGDARRVAAVDHDEDVRLLTVGGGKVHWSMARKGGPQDGVYEVPLSGGTARQIPGTTGFQVLTWPWIGGPGPGGPGTDKPGDRFHSTLRDLRNGRTQTAVLATIPGPWNCGITWCVGYRTRPEHPAGAESEPAVYLQRRDGAQGRVLEGVEPPVPQSGLLAYDRFLPYVIHDRSAPQIALYDVQSGKVGVTDLQVHEGAYSVPGPIQEPYNRLFTITRKGAYVLVDLAKIR